MDRDSRLNIVDATFQERRPRWERLLLWLFPVLELEGTTWRDNWLEERRQQFRTSMRIFTLFAAAFYIVQFFTIDIPAGVEPLSLWLQYRMGMALLCLGGCALTFWQDFVSSRAARPTYLGILLVMSYFLALSKTWDPRVPLFVVVVIPPLLTIFYSMSMLLSVATELVIYTMQYQVLLPILANDPEQLRVMMSTAIVALTIVGAFRSGYAKDVQAFIKRQLLIQERQRVIEAQKELTHQLKGFVPTEIFNRIVSFNSKHRMSITQATDEVIRLRKKTIACIYSDIRSFTKHSKDVDAYVLERSIPNIRLMTEIADSHRGICRLVGDLILAYFDQDEPDVSLLLAINCGFEMVEQNQNFNAHNQNAKSIQRNVIIAFGHSIVGNIGATDSAREITSLGPPINLSNRIDALLKSLTEQGKIELNNHLVLSSSAARQLLALAPGLDRRQIAIGTGDLTVRDFPEEQSLLLVPTTAANLQMIQQVMKQRMAGMPLTISQEQGEYAYGTTNFGT